MKNYKVITGILAILGVVTNSFGEFKSSDVLQIDTYIKENIFIQDGVYKLEGDRVCRHLVVSENGLVIKASESAMYQPEVLNLKSLGGWNRGVQFKSENSNEFTVVTKQQFDRSWIETESKETFKWKIKVNDEGLITDYKYRYTELEMSPFVIIEYPLSKIFPGGYDHCYLK